MTKSTIKEKGLEKDFSALNRITKPKKNDLANHADNEALSADSLLSGFFNEKPQSVKVAANKENDAPKPVNIEPAATAPVSKPIEVKPEVVVKQQVSEVEDKYALPESTVVKHEEDSQSSQFNIATRLKHNSNVETLSSPKNIENVVEQPEVPVKTSASLAKDRLNHVIHGLESTKETEVVTVHSKESESSTDKTQQSKRTANDALNKIFGQPSDNEQSASIPAMPLVNHQQDVNVRQDKSLFIPWDKASEPEKRKARKILSACVAGVVGMIALNTFH
ncbi:hypothetical protein [Serratia sp. Se-RSBMAAmG]|uniref:hypothetical protein n=1 Tax=Serratia sp. Se-RSBMAAmG TaxID=3043305 RepID=UPI0024AEFCF6|nr:hypothetical protein [Serratia sp. Se-RSBMAAmG]MDI6976650.1 hypothetical protein [Serratia sp. Se-RSBMAAmG]